MANGVELGVGFVSVVAETKSFAQQVEQAAKASGAGINRQFKVHGQKAGTGFGKAFGSQLTDSLPGVGGFKRTLAGYETAAQKAGAVAGKSLATAFAAAATAGVAGLGFTLFKGIERYKTIDAATHRLKNLNKTAAQLNKPLIDVAQTMKDLEDVVTGTPFALSDAVTQATNVIASGVKDVKGFMTDVADAAAFADDSIANIGQAFTQIANQGKIDAGILNNQLRNLPIRAWLKELYEDVDISEALRKSQFGIDHLRHAIQTFAGDTAQTAGDTLEGAISNLNLAFAKLGENILSALFGGPTQAGANGLKDAVNGITGHLKTMGAWVADNRVEIRDFFTTVVDAAKTLAGAVGAVVGVLGKVGIGVGDVVVAFVAWKSIAGVAALTSQITGISRGLEVTLPASARKGATGISAALARVNVPAWLLFLSAQAEDLAPNFPIQDQPTGEDRWFPGWVPILPFWEESIRRFMGGDAALGRDLSKSKQLPPLSIADMPIAMAPPGIGDGGPAWANPAPTKVWPGPPPLQSPSGDGDKDGEKAPKPVLPFNTTLPAWAQGPQTPGVFSAQSSWLDARHDLAEKQAYLNQLEQSNTATAAQIQDAKNDVIQADRRLQQQEMSLQKAKESAYKQFFDAGKQTTDQFQTLAGSLDNIVQLDQDLGLSRGLVGLADNLLKFLGGLAAAPLKGLLSGVTNALKPYTMESLMSARSGGGGGTGFSSIFDSVLSGMAGGVSGAISGSAGATGFANSRVAAMMNLARSSSGGTYAPASDLASGLSDCSGAVSDLVEVLTTGQATPGRLFTTHNAGSVLQSYGARRGFVPGNLNVGVLHGGPGGGHMSATLPNGVAFESGGGTGQGATYGGPAVGADHPQYTERWTIPVPRPQQPWNYPPWPGFSRGGGVDSVPAMLTPGEHVLTVNDVVAMGGQSGVYSFRKALHRNTGGPIGWQFPLQPVDEPPPPQSPDPGGGDLTQPSIVGQQQPGVSAGQAQPPFGAPSQLRTPDGGPGRPHLGPDLAGLGPNLPFGQQGVGPDGKPLSPQDQALNDALTRLAGFIPQAAKANTVAGTSNLSRLWMSGAEIINGLIDQGASAASTAVSAAITAGVAGGSFGAAAPAAPAAGAAGSAASQFLIGLGTEAAKRGVSYWAQMGGILSDTIVEHVFPLGAPSWIGFDSAHNSINGLIQQRKKAKSGGVFDTGGMLEPGDFAVNLSKRPEPVLTSQQWDLMAQTAQPAQTAPGYGVNIENVSVSDVNEMSRELAARQRLAAMRYTGRPGP